MRTMNTSQSTKAEMDAFLVKEPKAAPYFKEWYGAQELIRRKLRSCLWLGACAPHELRQVAIPRAVLPTSTMR